MTSILIVDDAAFSRRMIKKYLQADGYNILEATSGKEGLEMVINCQPDGILTDLLMPELNGFEFLEALQNKGFNIPTAVISADIQDSSRQRALELGATGFVNKPPKEKEVRQIVRQLFQQK
ncbi:MAG: response regulator [Xenococcaceae cyanobacterium]